VEFKFSEEQLMIRETAESFLRDNSTSEAIRKAMASEQGYDAKLWQRICNDLCFQSITIPEQHGGMGLGYVELVAVLEQMGRFLLCSPYFSTTCLASNALYVAGTETQQAEYFAKIINGETGTLLLNNSGKVTADAINVIYKKSANDYVLNGTYRYVIDGHTAHFFVAAASGEQGIALFVLPADSKGISRKWLPTVDQTRKQAEVVFNNVTVAATQCLKTDAGSELQKILQLAMIATAAEQMGAAQQILDMTVAYTKERVQFNRPIASFQAVKHQAADMMLKAEVARSAVYYAACVADDTLRCGSLSAELPEAASIAKAWCSDAFFQNAAAAMQLHGGVGFTWEYDVHLYFKRAKSSEIFLGNAAFHRERIAQILLDQP
jgi:alkylation response protein AidB-like acyl-CoA dehydrogenase